MLAAAKMQIEPASAPPPRTNFAKRPTPSKSSAIASGDDLFDPELTTTNPLSKGSFAARAQHEETNLVTASLGSASADDFFWWPTRWLLNTGSLVRRDASNGPVDITFTTAKSEPEPKPVPVQKASAAWGLGDFISLLQGAKASTEGIVATGTGKSDRLLVNRSGKGDIQPRSLRDKAIEALQDASLKSSSLD